MSTGRRAWRSNQYLRHEAGEIGGAAGRNRQALQLGEVERQALVRLSTFWAAKST